MEQIDAYHEAGHALLATLVGARVVSLTVDPESAEGDGEQVARSAEACIAWDRSQFGAREFCQAQLMVALAGPVAEMLHRGQPLHPARVPEWQADWQEAWRVAEQLVPDPPRRMALLEQMTRQLYRQLERDDYWQALASLVDQLDAHRWLESEEVEQIVWTWLEPPDGSGRERVGPTD